MWEGTVEVLGIVLAPEVVGVLGEAPRAFQDFLPSLLVDLATLAQFRTALLPCCLLSFLSQFPSHQSAQLCPPLLLHILPQWQQQQRTVKAGWRSALL